MNEDEYYGQLYAAYEKKIVEGEELAEHDELLTQIKYALDDLKEAMEIYEKSRFNPLFTSIDSFCVDSWLDDVKQAQEALYEPEDHTDY